MVIFVFLLLTTLFDDLGRAPGHRPDAEPAGPEPGRPVRPAAAVADGSSCRSRKTSSRRTVDKWSSWSPRSSSAIPAFIAFAIIPFGPDGLDVRRHQTPLQLTDLPVAVLLVLAMGSIGVYGIVLAGWSSGSPYSLLGGLRSAAQVISYEIAMGLSFVAVFLYAGSLSTSEIVNAQASRLVRCRRAALPVLVDPADPVVPDLPDHDGRRDQPAAVRPARGRGRAGRPASTPSTPSLKFAMFFLAEYVNMITVSALATTLFLGGWRAPWPISLWSGANTGWWPLLWFLVKVLIFCSASSGCAARCRGSATTSSWRSAGRSSSRSPSSGSCWSPPSARLAAGRPLRRSVRGLGRVIVLILALLAIVGQLGAAAGRAARDQRRTRPAPRSRTEVRTGSRPDRPPTATGFPVPPLDLPHYHGVGIAQRRPPSKEVTGA